MALWSEWFQCVRQLRPACHRFRTFLWMTMTLAAFCSRPEFAGITSLIRALGFDPAAYRRFLHFFHTPAVSIDRLTELWIQLVLKRFRPVRVREKFLVCLVDGIKIAKEGKKMPAVKALHQDASSNSKPAFIMGHSFQAASLLVEGPAGHVAAVPLTSRIHEGVIWSNRDRRTLLDKAVALVLSLASQLRQPVFMVADAYYGSRKVITPLLAQGHHLVTRARSNTVAYRRAPRAKKRRRGRPKLYGFDADRI